MGCLLLILPFACSLEAQTHVSGGFFPQSISVFPCCQRSPEYKCDSRLKLDVRRSKTQQVAVRRWSATSSFYSFIHRWALGWGYKWQEVIKIKSIHFLSWEWCDRKAYEVYWRGSTREAWLCIRFCFKVRMSPKSRSRLWGTKILGADLMEKWWGFIKSSEYFFKGIFNLKDHNFGKHSFDLINSAAEAS